MSDPLRKQFQSALGQFFSAVPELARSWGSSFDALQFDTTPWAPMTKPLHQARIALITTGGVHRLDDPPFNMQDQRGDASFRTIPADTPRSHLTITHDYYNHSDADRDLNILFPLALLNELASEGWLGSVATCYGFMGHIEPPHLETLLTDTAPQVAGLLKQDAVDAVLLTPA